MNILGFDIKRSTKKINPPAIKKIEDVEASHSSWGNTWVDIYDGEKNPGEMGPIIDYAIDYYGLSNRSWQSYLESDISKIVLSRMAVWIIDKGLKLQSIPADDVLKSEGINIDVEALNNRIESRFNIWTKSNRSSYSGMLPLNELAKEAFINAKVGGDVLVVLRYEKKTLNVQLIDGRHLYSAGNNLLNERGNRVINGIEIDKRGRHIKYHVRSRNIDTITGSEFFTGIESLEIDAWDSTTGLRKAFLIYGSKYRLDDHRGLPKIASSLETISATDRYKEASVQSAEERAKVVFTINHNQHSDGKSPLGPFAEMDSAVNDGSVPIDAAGNKLAKTVTSTTGKQTFNMTQGSEMKTLDSKSETQFKEFLTTNANFICSAVNIPPDVAFSMYNGSFSASRAATKDWDHTMTVERDNFDTQFYSPIYAFWFHFQVLTGKIQAPGYLEAFVNDDWMVVEAYLCHAFTGPMFPHIDPKKEADAERVLLGPTGLHIPLTTVEAATAKVGTGESNSNIEQFAKEVEKAKELGLIPEEPDAVEPVNEPVDPDGDE